MGILRFWNGSALVRFAKSFSTWPLKMYDGTSIINIPLVAEGNSFESGVRIHDGSVDWGIPEYGWYGLRRMQYSSHPEGQGTLYNLIDNFTLQGIESRIYGGGVLSASSLTYSTSSGDWAPSSSKTKDLTLNVDGTLLAYGARHPVVTLRLHYGIYYDTKVEIKAHAKGMHGSVTAYNLTYTYERKSATVIAVNGVDRTITPGGYYEVAYADWNPADSGDGGGWIRVYNTSADYFEVDVYVYEIDEQNDSSWTWIDTYIKQA